MKPKFAILAIIGFAAATTTLNAQDYPDEYLGLPGDNLNLYAVMNIFQESETLEKFEQNLNNEENMVNNLDLNGDNLIDYITVSDYQDGNVHNIVLRALLGRNEQQDVAVFVVEQKRNGAVEIQLIGDEALYGPNYIVEPIYAETPNPGYTGKAYTRNVNVVTTTYYDIAAWPVIMYMYRPGYVVWRSSWYWGYYPGYWNPWRAHYWHYYYGYHYHWHDYYYAHYRPWDHYRCRSYRTYYTTKVRVYSPTVAVNINQGRYRTTYSQPSTRRAGEEYYTRTASTRATATRPATSTRSTTTARPATSTRSTTTARPATSTRSTTTARPATSTRSTTTARPATSTRSTTTARPAETNRSSTTARPATTNRSSTTARPATKSTENRSTSVQKSQPARSSSSVQRSQSSQPSRSSSAVKSSSSSKRSSSAVKSSSSSNRSSGTVKRSSSSNKSSSPSRSSGSRSSSSKSSSGSKSSSSSRSSSSSSSRR
ncbi:MAG: hypothetical protein R2751_10340 [Bacteroidales bacterium]